MKPSRTTRLLGNDVLAKTYRKHLGVCRGRNTWQ